MAAAPAGPAEAECPNTSRRSEYKISDITALRLVSRLLGVVWLTTNRSLCAVMRADDFLPCGMLNPIPLQPPSDGGVTRLVFAAGGNAGATQAWVIQADT